MKPILGETVLSIIHGPATTGHIVETSEFLRREIDVWTEGRLFVIGGDHYRQQPCLSVAHTKVASSDAGHFTLVNGDEPRNPDAGCHPDNCAFDAVSDQTGYPASLLRQVVAQRMLIKLYQSRLRGHDYPVQCSSCSISGAGGGQNSCSRPIDTKKALKIYTMSRDIWNGHPHHNVLHRSKDCHCTTEKANCVRAQVKVLELLSDQCKLHPIKLCFRSELDLAKALAELMNSPEGQTAQATLLHQKCNPQLKEKENKRLENPMHMRLNEQRIETNASEVQKCVGHLRLKGVAYHYVNKTSQSFQIKLVRAVLFYVSAFNRGTRRGEVGIRTIYPVKET